MWGGGGENNGGGKLHRQCVCVWGEGGRIMEEESFTDSVCVCVGGRIMEEESFTDSVCVGGGGENNGGGKLHRQCVCGGGRGENNGGGKLHRQCVCVCVCGDIMEEESFTDSVCVCGENNGGGKLHRQCVCGGRGGE